jgi:hypothetical protein
MVQIRVSILDASGGSMALDFDHCTLALRRSVFQLRAGAQPPSVALSVANGPLVNSDLINLARLKENLLWIGENNVYAGGSSFLVLERQTPKRRPYVSVDTLASWQAVVGRSG